MGAEIKLAMTRKQEHKSQICQAQRKTHDQKPIKAVLKLVEIG